MLAKAAAALPEGPGWLYEPKWDGFRALVFRSADDLYMQSRELKPLDRYFPELREALLAAVPPGASLDGEIVIATAAGLDFDALQQRVHPAASRIARLAAATPASFVAFDLLAGGGDDLRALPFATAGRRLEQLLAGAAAPSTSRPSPETWPSPPTGWPASRAPASTA